MTHTQPWAVSTPHWVQVIGFKYLSIFILIFPWWVTVFCFITHFLFDLSSDSFMLFWKGNFWNLPLTHWWAIAYWSQKCAYLRIPSCYKEAVLPQWKDDQVQVYSQLSYFQQDLKLNSLDYSISICQQLSSRSWPLWLHHQRCSNYVSF